MEGPTFRKALPRENGKRQKPRFLPPAPNLATDGHARHRLFLLRRDHHDHLAALEAREALDHGFLDDILLDALDHGLAEFHMRHLAALEADDDLDLVALFEEALEIAHLHVVIAILGGRTELEFLDLDLFRLALGRVRLLLLLELELAEVHDAADRRVRRGLDLDEVEPRFLGHAQGRVAREDTHLLPVSADHAYLRNTDLRVLAVSLLGGA